MTIKMVRAPVYTGHQAKQGISTVMNRERTGLLEVSSVLLLSLPSCNSFYSVLMIFTKSTPPKLNPNCPFGATLWRFKCFSSSLRFLCIFRSTIAVYLLVSWQQSSYHRQTSHMLKLAQLRQLRPQRHIGNDVYCTIGLSIFSLSHWKCFR